MNVLFVCTHNRCRSILAEAVFRHFARLHKLPVQFRSAGSQPAGLVHPESLAALRRHGIDCEGLHSQSWDEFGDWNCERLITVCDSAANEACPHRLLSAQSYHWGLSDPSRLPGSADDRAQAFDQLIELLSRRAQLMVAAYKAQQPEQALAGFDSAQFS